MTPPLFLAARAALAAPEIVLDGPEGHHAADVRRVAPGERVDVGDGAGQVARCTVAAVHRGRVTLTVLDRVVTPAPQPRLVVVQALAKGDRVEHAVEAMTEVGVDELVPWAAARSIVRWEGERGAKALARWRVTAREAAKQARRPWLPAVADLATTADVSARARHAATTLVLHESAKLALPDDVPDEGDVVLVVGPEGGVTDAELDVFCAAGAVAVRLGPTVLRSVTAGVAGAAAVLARSRRWRDQ